MSTDQQPPPPGVLTSLLRSLSTRKSSDSPRPSSAAPPAVQEPSKVASGPKDTPAPAVDRPRAQTTIPPAPRGNVTTTTTVTASTAPAPAHKEKKDNPGYFRRLKTLKKDKKPEITTTGKSQPKVKFIDTQPVIDVRAPDTKPNTGPQSVPDVQEVTELAELAAVAEEYTNPSKPVVPPVEPSKLGKLIQSLIDILPPLSPDTPVPKQKPVKRDHDGKPIPPSDSGPIEDPKVIAQLSSPSIMNGSLSTGKKSVWSVLETLGPPKHAEDERDPGTGSGGDHGDDMSDTSSVMLYAPLIPTDNSVVQVAMSELRPAMPPVGAQSAELKAKRLSFPWGSRPKPASPVKLVQVWVPSRTKLSVETKWWGYRLYLPPPVLSILGQKEAEAAKIATIITAALTWVIENLPINAVPLPLQPAVLILKRLAPYLTYIGAFIAWSWTSISGFDKGYGVILSATWVLPIALIPTTWSPPATMIPPPNPATKPVPATPASSAAAPAVASTSVSHPASAHPSSSAPKDPAEPTKPTKPLPSKPADGGGGGGGFLQNLFRTKTK